MYFLDIQILFYGSCIVALAGIIRGFTGFGNMMIMSPGLSLIFGPVMAIPMIYIIELPIVTFFLFKLFKKIQWKKIIILASSSLVFAPIGLYLLQNLDVNITKKIIGIVVIVVALLLFFKIKLNIKGKFLAQIIFGSMSGLIGGSTGLGGPPVVSYFLISNFTADEIRSNITGTFFIRVSASIIFTIILGLLSWKIVIIALSLIPSYLLFSLIGDYLYKFSNDNRYKKIALIIFLSFGLIIILN